MRTAATLARPALSQWLHAGSFGRRRIAQAVWPYLRFALSYRDVEELLAERGIAVSYETVRRWVPR